MSQPLSQHAATLREVVHPILGGSDYDALVASAAKARIVMIGEASHGTQEFYAVRATLTRRLIQEAGFRAVAVEADWPDSFRAHRYATGRGDDPDAATALTDFRRFPSWMWRNTVVVEFLEWLRSWNLGFANPAERTGFYGIDLYSLHTSIEAVLRYLDASDPEAAARARARYACFGHFSREPQAYGHATTVRGQEPCEEEVVAQLLELQERTLALRPPHSEQEELFSAEQNARLVVNAERYYRAMFRGRDESWNLRDTHMYETLEQLLDFLDGGAGKVVVWAHNSHLGDARATAMGRQGEINLGQLVRQHHGPGAFNIGFTTYSGTVTAASDWDAPMERKQVRPGLPGSYEALFHSIEVPAFWLNLRDENRGTEILRRERLERAIGVIYLPATERWSHYFEANLPEQFDAVIHLDHTHALRPLDRSSQWDPAELPETYPSAL
jgi:erythromycin esterase-like protein